MRRRASSSRPSSSAAPDDFEEYYCPTIDWEWGDDTTSESTADCEPYEAGKSEIKRRFTVEHVFRHGGNFRGLSA